MKTQAFETSSLTESILGFVQYLRNHGLNVGIQESQDALISANLGLLQHKNTYKICLKKLFCQSPEEGIIFEKLYYAYWDTNPIDIEERSKNQTKVQGTKKEKGKSSIAILGIGKANEEKKKQEDAKEVTGSNETERLKKIDLSLLNTIDAEKLEIIAKRLFKQMSVRLRKRTKESKKKGQIHLRKTLRRSMSYGGTPMTIYRKSKMPKKKRLIVFLDISGSMDKYSFFLLRFICALKENFRQLEAFVFSTSLRRITKNLDYRRLDFMLDSISSSTENWGSGTKIGECFKDFNTYYSKRLLNGMPIVLILSDGLDTGDENDLKKELSYIQRRAKKIIWLNPLKGMKNYQPKTKGMLAALPSIDDFRSAHNLDSLLELENILKYA